MSLAPTSPFPRDVLNTGLTIPLFPGPDDYERLFRCRAGEGDPLALHPQLRDLLEAPVEAIADYHEEHREDRRAAGVYYTPPELARALVDVALESLGHAPATSLDPACGTGSLLDALALALLGQGGEARTIWQSLGGIDLDPGAITIARWRVLERLGLAQDIGLKPLSPRDRQRWLIADALDPETRPWAIPELVVANPPFGNAIGQETRRDDEQKSQYRKQFPHAARGAYDKAGLFVERSIQWTRHGARLALVLPRALLAASYAEELRAWIDKEHRLQAVLSSDASDHFSTADVMVSGAVIEARHETLGLPLFSSQPAQDRSVRCIQLGGGEERRLIPPEHRWAALISPHYAALAAIGNDWRRLGDCVEVQAGASVGEAYEMRDHVQESPAVGDTWTPPEKSSGWALVTTGLIDPDSCYWGSRPCRYLGTTWQAPWLPREAVRPTRAALYDQPKVLVAGLSQMLEALVDREGQLAAAVATLTLRVPGDRPEALQALSDWLNSSEARAQYAALFGAQELSGGSVQVTKRNLSELRIPPGLARHLQVHNG